MKRKYSFEEIIQAYSDVVLVNAAITIIIVTVVSALLAITSYESRGAFTVGAEYLIIGVVAGLTPVILLKVEQFVLKK